MKPRKHAQPRLAADRKHPVPSARLRWAFRVIALLSPLLLLAVAEIFLRISGYGYPAGFFLKQKFGGRDVLTENWQFGWRFFPKEIARTPQPVVFSAHKAPGTIRIFVFGESAAMGDPEPAFGLPRLLQAMLELKFPSNRFEVINVAMTAINSHVVREIARDCAPLEGDVWIIYMGNNEVVGPFGGGTVFGRQAPSLAFVRATLWLKRFRLVQWLSSLGAPGPVEWEGMEMFLKQQVQRDEPRMQRVYAHFRRNLDGIIRLGTHSGARVIVSTVPVNLKDCPPLASQHDGAVSAPQRAEFQKEFDRGVALETTNQFDRAREAFLKARQMAATGRNGFADLYFHLARCELALGQDGAARTNFNLAKEYDTLRFRADDRINSEIRAAAAAAKSSVGFVDAVNVFAAQSPAGAPGRTDFYEHVHLTWEGNYRLAHALFDAVVASLPAQSLGASAANFPAMSDCARRLGWTDWDRLQVYEEIRKRLRQPPFTAQFGHEARDREWQKSIEELGAGLTPEKYQRAVAEYQETLRVAPRDWVLRENFARLLEANGDVARAIEEWNEVARLLPHDIQAQYHLGNLLDTLGRSQEALAHFRAALVRNPASVETRNGLALALGSLGKQVEAEREFNAALRLKPKFTEARVNLGQLLAQQGKTDAAIAQYKIALQNDTNSAAAHVNLGKLLNQRGDKAGALAHYTDALRINPGHAVAHYNMGNLLRDTQPAEAERHFTEAIRAKPNFAEAHLALALQLAQTGRAVDAEKHFLEAIRLQPDSADAHFNHGASLANQARFGEASKEFSQTLKLQPDYPRAREFLERAQRMK